MNLEKIKNPEFIKQLNIEELNDKLKNAKRTKYDFENRTHLSIISSTMTRKCMDIFEVCRYRNFSNENRNIVLLMFAKEYYYIEDYVTGDKLISYVESQKYKSPKVKRLLNEIKSDRNSYKNRTEEMGASLILAPNI